MSLESSDKWYSYTLNYSWSDLTLVSSSYCDKITEENNLKESFILVHYFESFNLRSDASIYLDVKQVNLSWQWDHLAEAVCLMVAMKEEGGWGAVR